MKYLCVILFLTFSIKSFSQNNDSYSSGNQTYQETEAGEDEVEYNQNNPFDFSGLVLYLGTRPTVIPTAIIQLDYTDESPSRDNFSTVKSMTSINSSLSAEAGFSFGKRYRLNHEILFGVSLSEDAFRMYGTYGLGYNLSFLQDRFVLRPVANIAWGVTHFQLGEMENNAEYIEINDTRYYDDELNVILASRQFFASGRMELLVKITDNLGLSANVGYQQSLTNSKPFLKFIGRDTDQHDEEQRVAEKEKLSEANVSLELDNEGIDKIPLDLDGLFYGLGIYFFF